MEINLQPGTRLRSGGKRQKTGLNRKNIGERSEPSGGLGRGKGLADFFRPRRFFSPFPQCGSWSQAIRALKNDYEKNYLEKLVRFWRI